jgi:hypothetical protein
MNNLEAFQPQENLETTNAAVEMVGYTRIGNFETSRLISGEHLAEQLRELPLTHLENCSSIRYEPESSYFSTNPLTLAFFESDAREITVGPAKRFESENELLETVTHGVGHNVYEDILNQRPELTEQWTDLHTQSQAAFSNGEGGFVSDYARSDVREDFAETHKMYVHDPEYLRFVNPEKYEFMRNQVFSGIRFGGNPIVKELASITKPIASEAKPLATEVIEEGIKAVKDIVGDGKLIGVIKKIFESGTK